MPSSKSDAEATAMAVSPPSRTRRPRKAAVAASITIAAVTGARRGRRPSATLNKGKRKADQAKLDVPSKPTTAPAPEVVAVAATVSVTVPAAAAIATNNDATHEPKKAKMTTTADDASSLLSTATATATSTSTSATTDSEPAASSIAVPSQVPQPTPPSAAVAYDITATQAHDAQTDATTFHALPPAATNRHEHAAESERVATNPADMLHSRPPLSCLSPPLSPRRQRLHFSQNPNVSLLPPKRLSRRHLFTKVSSASKLVENDDEIKKTDPDSLYQEDPIGTILNGMAIALPLYWLFFWCKNIGNSTM